MERHKKRVKEAKEYVESLTLEEMRIILINYKNTYINKTEIRKKQDFITNLNVILFTPDDLEIIKGAPQVRRNLLNIEISQMDKDYIKYLNEYNKILKNRNEYLKTLYINHLSDYRYLDILTEKLIDRVVVIYK